MVIALLLLGRLTVKFDYGEKLFLKVSYLFFPIIKIPAKKRKTEKKDKKAERAAKKTKKKVKKERKKLSLSEILQFLQSLKKPVGKIMKRIKFSHVGVDITAGGEDAAKAALNFGKLNIAVGNALAAVDSLFTLKSIDDVHIGVDFYQEKTDVNCRFEVSLSLGGAIAFAFALLMRLFKLLSDDDGVKHKVREAEK